MMTALVQLCSTEGVTLTSSDVAEAYITMKKGGLKQPRTVPIFIKTSNFIINFQ